MKPNARSLAAVATALLATGAASLAADPAATKPAHPLTSAEALMSGEAWVAYTNRIRDLGLAILGAEFPRSERERAEGFRHLSAMVAMGLQWEVEFVDTDFPAFYRHDDDITKWGAQNVDNTYLRAHIDGSKTYRLSGNISTIQDLIISTSSGDMHDGKFTVAGDLDRTQLDLDEGGNFELMIGPSVNAEKGLRTPRDHVRLEIREYFNDWSRETPAEFHLERVSPGPSVPPPLTPASMAQRLDAAATWAERSVLFWREWGEKSVMRQPPNTLGKPGNVPGGSADIFYGGGSFDLEPGQALLIESGVPKARNWSFQWYVPGWFEAPDFANRQTSLNGSQAHVDTDGRVRVVVSAEDPGIQNWLDTTGHGRGLISYRWIWSQDAPVPSARVVAVSKLREQLPKDTPRFDAEARRAQIAERRRHIERRFRR